MTALTDDQNLAKALAYTKAILWITATDQDTILWHFIKTAVAMIHVETWIDLLTVAEIVDVMNGAWQRSIQVEFAPIIAISKIEYNSNKRWTADRKEIDADDYVFDDAWTITFCFPLYRGTQNIRITYSAFTDFATIPRKYEQLKVAMSLIAWNILNTRKQGGLSSESVSWTSLVFDKKAITSDIQQMIDQYKSFAI